MLFNLVVDALTALIENAQDACLIKGLVSHLIPKGVPLLQYTDDTILMIECEEVYILHLKFLLYCFEWLSGLKINYHKSEVYVLGVEKEEAVSLSYVQLQVGAFAFDLSGD